MRRDYSLSLYSVKGTSSLLSTKSYFPPDTEQVPHSPVGSIGADERSFPECRNYVVFKEKTTMRYIIVVCLHFVFRVISYFRSPVTGVVLSPSVFCT